MKISRNSWHYKLADFAGYRGYSGQLNIALYLLHVVIGMIPFFIDLLFIVSIYMVFQDIHESLVTLIVCCHAVYLFWIVLIGYLESKYIGPFSAWKIFGIKKGSVIEKCVKIEITD